MKPIMLNGDTAGSVFCGAGMGTKGGSPTATPPGLAPYRELVGARVPKTRSQTERQLTAFWSRDRFFMDIPRRITMGNNSILVGNSGRPTADRPQTTLMGVIS